MQRTRAGGTVRGFLRVGALVMTLALLAAAAHELSGGAAVAAAQAGACTSVTLSANPASPQMMGTPVTLTASAQGCTPAEYQFWVHDGTSWSVKQAWSPAPIYSWNTGGLSGTVYAAVWARATGSDASSPQAQASISYQFRTPSSCTGVTLTASPDPSVQPLSGTVVTLTGAASGCTGAVYQFWLYDGSAWSVLRPWGPPTMQWDTSGISGTVFVAVWVRSSGSTATSPDAQTSIAYTLRAADACTSATVTPSVASPQTAGADITWTASATICTTPEYQFWLYSGSAWTVARAWGTGATWSWNTSGTANGTFFVAVWARQQGSGTTSPQAQATRTYVLTPGSGACTSVTLTPSPAAPQTAGATVTLTAAASGCASAEYQFWVHNGSTWTVGGAWDSAATYQWNTTGLASGLTYLAVWARAAGSGASSPQAQTSIQYQINGAGSCSAVTLAASPAAPQAAGTSITWTAAATGCTGPQYQFWTWNGAWSVARAWSATPIFAWNTSGLPNGVAYVSVWARAGGATADSPQAQTVQPYEIGTPGTLATQGIAGGSQFTCALASGGGVKCWGFNGNGVLGNGTTTSSAVPITIPGLSGARAVVAGAAHACALLSDGTVRCWGRNNYGQLGDGTTTDRSAPAAVSGLTDVAALAAGDFHTCALILSTGRLRCWGQNLTGQIGNGMSGSSRLSPVEITTAAAVRSIGAGISFTCAALTTGAVQCWGLNNTGQLGAGTATDRWSPTAVSGITTATAVAVGGLHACALLGDGTTRCWGDNSVGQLGDGTTTDRWAPVAPTGLGGVTVKAVAAGRFFTCIHLATNGARCTGDNSFGELGNGTTTNSTTYVTVADVNTSVAALAAGPVSDHACVSLAADTGAHCWGRNNEGQVGDGTTTNRGNVTRVVGLGLATRVATGGVANVGPGGTAGHACALLGGGIINCWGSNSSGQLGDGTTTSRTLPATVSGIAGASRVDAGDEFTCALVSGSVRCWGRNDKGQLGNGTTTNSSTPVTVTGITTATAIAAGARHACARLSDGTVQCWGENEFGQVGDGTFTSRSTPVTVHTGSGLNRVPLSGVSGVAAGDQHTCVIITAGALRCWGGNSNGQLGNSSTQGASDPVAVSGLTGASEVTAGRRHTCAISALTAYCWGQNTSGQIGIGTTTDSTRPASVSGVTDVVLIAAGGQFSCAVTAASAGFCWGSNGWGQLGNSASLNLVRTTPVTVDGSHSFSAIDAGGKFTCGVAGGTVLCWGDNALGQLGTGSTGGLQASPVTVVGL
jgi:alpha-tubulin suppressor-like RCC1 family protein